MIKRLASLISAFVICFVLFPLSCFESHAEMLTGYPPESTIIDEAGIYDDDKETFDDLNKELKDTAEELGLNLIIFLAGTKRSDEATMIFADDSYDEIFGEDTDGIFYYMDDTEAFGLFDYISTSGSAVLKYEPHKESIFDSLDFYLPSSGEKIQPEMISNAIHRYLRCLKSYSSEEISPFAYHYDKYKNTYAYYTKGQYTVSDHKPWFVYVIPFFKSLIAGTITALIIALVTKKNYKFKGSHDPKSYIARNLSKFTVNQDVYIRTDTHRTRISSSSSGGGGGSHRSHHSSGHSHHGHHGGGGHHR
ncbi:MAG: hypothetical protein IJ779_00975 [Ruminococcus sp.]|nr:hypothetical protein [Ruminococcus sp.]